MKKLLLVVISVMLTGMAFASNWSKEIVSRRSNDGNESITQQMNQSLILEQPSNVQLRADWHSSHSSHYSHGSHGSHSSHSSHYSSRF